MDSAPGTYIVVYRCDHSRAVTIGRWASLQLQPGLYFYVGSAFGPGGVRARVTRHCRREKALRWHVDYLSTHCDAAGAWYSHAPERLEHQWAQSLQTLAGMNAIEGFGCSDCTCDAHLFHTTRNTRLNRRKAFRESHLLWYPVEKLCK